MVTAFVLATWVTNTGRFADASPQNWPRRGRFLADDAGLHWPAAMGALLFITLEAALLHISPKARERIRLLLHRWTT